MGLCRYLFLAGAISLILTVFIFIGDIKDTEVDVELRAEFRRKRTLGGDGGICIGTPQVGKIFLSSTSKKIEKGLKINYNGLEINSESFKMKNEKE